MVTRKNKKRRSPKPRADVCDHFAFRHLPFTREIAIRDRWRHSQYEDLQDDLRQTVENRLSAAIIAPAGTGKTVVLRGLTDVLPEARYRVHYVKVTDLSKRDFCRELATAVGAKAAGYYGALVRNIQDRCQTLMDQESVRPVLIIDEAHDVRPDVLAILRVLANFEMDSRLVISFILAGQSPLRALLRKDTLEEVSRRLALIASLRLLSRDEIKDYINHRLRLVGATSDIFDRHATEAIFESTQGNLRAIDSISLRSLQIAAADNTSVIDSSIVTNARAQVWP